MSADLRSRILEKLVAGMTPDAIFNAADFAAFSGTEISKALDIVNQARRTAARRAAASRAFADWMASVRRRLLEVSNDLPVLRSIDGDTFYRMFYAQNRPVMFQETCLPECERIAISLQTCKLNLVGSESSESKGSEGVPPLRQQDSKSFLDLRDLIGRFPNQTNLGSVEIRAGTNPTVDKLLNAFDPLPTIVESYGRSGDDVHNVISSEGAITALSYNTFNVLFASLSGDARITLFPPQDYCFLYAGRGTLKSPVSAEDSDSSDYPLSRCAHGLSGVVSRGSALFIPVGWWHSIRSLTPTFSVQTRRFLASNVFPEPPR